MKQPDDAPSETNCSRTHSQPGPRTGRGIATQLELARRESRHWREQLLIRGHHERFSPFPPRPLQTDRCGRTRFWLRSSSVAGWRIGANRTCAVIGQPDGAEIGMRILDDLAVTQSMPLSLQC